MSCAFSSKAWSRSARSAMGSLPSLRISSARATHVGITAEYKFLGGRNGRTSQLLQPRESSALLLVDGAAHRVVRVGRAGLRATLKALDATEQRLERWRDGRARLSSAAGARGWWACSSPPCATQPHWCEPQNPVRGARGRESRRTAAHALTLARTAIVVEHRISRRARIREPLERWP